MDLRIVRNGARGNGAAGKQRHRWADPVRVKLLGRRFIKRCDIDLARRVRLRGQLNQWSEWDERHRR